ncbi:MAG: hypothetical protein RIC55_20805 [Pirellulaceae bacterium]
MAALTLVMMEAAAADWPMRPTPPTPLRLMSAEKDARLRSYLPHISDSDLQRILKDDRLILYTDKEMPRAYQDWDGALQGVHSPSYNISANGSEPFGNGNREFPWSTPAGTHRCDNVTSFRFLWLPQDEQGEPLPIVWYRKRFPGDNVQGYAWVYPVGTVFGEVLRQRGPDGKDYTFELRVRIREYGQWAVDVFRPFPTAKELAHAVKQHRPAWEKDEQLAKLVSHLQTPAEMPKLKLIARHPAQVTFKQSMGVDTLPTPGDDLLVAELLTQTPFRSSLGEVWRETPDGVETCAPTTASKFHIVPAKYDAGFIEVNRISCMRCHETTAQHVRKFEPYRDWYGRIRGSDGIFSFHPFCPTCISGNGYGGAVRLRPELKQAGLLKAYDARQHPAAIYQQVE